MFYCTCIQYRCWLRVEIFKLRLQSEVNRIFAFDFSVTWDKLQPKLQSEQLINIEMWVKPSWILTQGSSIFFQISNLVAVMSWLHTTCLYAGSRQEPFSAPHRALWGCVLRTHGLTMPPHFHLQDFIRFSFDFGFLGCFKSVPTVTGVLNTPSALRYHGGDSLLRRH